MTPEQRVAAAKGPNLSERQHLAGLLGALSHLSTNPAAWQLNEAMSRAYADQQHHIAAPGPFHADQLPWEKLDEDGKNIIRLGCMAATEAARRIRSQRQESAG